MEIHCSQDLRSNMAAKSDLAEGGVGAWGSVFTEDCQAGAGPVPFGNCFRKRRCRLGLGLRDTLLNFWHLCYHQCCHGRGGIWNLRLGLGVWIFR